MNEKELILTPKELYCLGGVLNAKYIDYAYIAAMDDIGQDFALFQRETTAELVDKEILLEDFSGDMEPNGAYLELLQPIFFGTVETSLDICRIGDKVEIDVCKFHFFRDAITMVKGCGETLMIKSVSQEDIRGFVKSIVTQPYEAATGEPVNNYDMTRVRRFLSAKNIDVGKSSEVRTFIEHDGVFCTEKEDGTLVCLSSDDFVNEVFNTIKGAV